jgi:hypothetical protein
MNDRISRYRVVRLAIHVPAVDGSRAHWSLIATGVKGGIPSSTILSDGTVALAARNPTTEEIIEALDACVRQMML